MSLYNESDIRLAMQAHDCSEEDAINLGYAAQVAASRQKQKSEAQKVLYKQQRAAEYPDFREYLDGVVKGDQAQIQAYIDACNVVKAKYPKGQ